MLLGAERTCLSAAASIKHKVMEHPVLHGWMVSQSCERHNMITCVCTVVLQAQRCSAWQAEKEPASQVHASRWSCTDLPAGERGAIPSAARSRARNVSASAAASFAASILDSLLRKATQAACPLLFSNLGYTWCTGGAASVNSLPWSKPTVTLSRYATWNLSRIQ